MNIKSNLQEIQKQIPPHVKLIAVSKTKPVEDILEAYHTGQLMFGENKAQELQLKYTQLSKDIQWHFIGHLQTNKIKYISPFVHLIHSVDSFKLLVEIDKEAKKHNRIIDCLLQFYIATEETKYGFDMEEAELSLGSEIYSTLKNIRIVGVMGMATYTEDEQLIRTEFKQLKMYFDTLKTKYFVNNDSFKELSMGMTSDYHIAIEEGSTMVRIGSAIFGERNYQTN
ncbi:MAG: YggS family pyridoxal phosphate-dependent enzyme [Bacteroidota bacterium]